MEDSSSCDGITKENSTGKNKDGDREEKQFVQRRTCFELFGTCNWRLAIKTIVLVIGT